MKALEFLLMAMQEALDVKLVAAGNTPDDNKFIITGRVTEVKDDCFTLTNSLTRAEVSWTKLTEVEMNGNKVTIFARP